MERTRCAFRVRGSEPQARHDRLPLLSSFLCGHAPTLLPRSQELIAGAGRSFVRMRTMITAALLVQVALCLVTIYGLIKPFVRQSQAEAVSAARLLAGLPGETDVEGMVSREE